MSTYVLGSTAIFRLTALKDGVVWDLSGATVTLLLRPPSGATAVKSATVTDAPGGVAQYTATTTDILTVGQWFFAWRVVQASIDITSERLILSVVQSP